MDKKATIEQFLKALYAENVRTKSAQNDYDEVFGKDGLFSIVCNKCGNVNIEIIGEGFQTYGEETGTSPGHLAIKCNECGTANTIYF